MSLLWFIIGVIVGFIIAWYYFNQQCRSQLADRDDEIARLRTELANAKSRPELAAKPVSSTAPGKESPSAGKGSAGASSSASGTASEVPSSSASSTPGEKPASSGAASEPQSLLQAPGLNTEPDDLTRIKGIGRVLQAKLNELGIVTFQQIAEFGPADIERVNEKLDFPGRIERERWVEQAKVFAEKGSPTTH